MLINYSLSVEKKSTEVELIKFTPLNSTQKDPPYPLKKIKISKHDLARECDKKGFWGFSVLDRLLETKKYKIAFAYVRSRTRRLRNKKMKRKIFIRDAISAINFNLMTDTDIILGIRRLNPWFKELIIYLIWKTDGRALNSLWCKLDFPSIERLLKLQVGLCPREEDEKKQIQNVKNILDERQKQLLNIPEFCPDVIKMICQY